MFINRITFSIEKNKFNEQEWLDFNRVTNYHEELLHHFLPRKVNLGGFGFFCNKLYTNQNSIKIKPYGQCIDYFHKVDQEYILKFLTLEIKKQIEELNRYLKKAILDISKEHKVDTDLFIDVLDKLPNAYLGIKQKLKVSKNHKSRKIKIEIVRSVNLYEEQIICQVLDKSNSVIDEWVLEDDSSIYDYFYSYSKSKWEENNLNIYDRFDRIHQSINVNEYLK